MARELVHLERREFQASELIAKRIGKIYGLFWGQHKVLTLVSFFNRLHREDRLV